ncbi:MAG: hypothetical protein RL092_1143 [Bacteroidota bacterium]|jgi:S-adenosylmethionine:tRNA ribosyltransferase-isomerase
MNGVPKIPLSEYFYDLPDHRIAHFPMSPRDHSKLLVFSEGQITDAQFFNLANYIHSDCTIVANNTKVIPARMWFVSSRNQKIQVFILKPIAADWSVCEVMIGNRKKFKEDDILRIENDNLFLEVKWVNRDTNFVKFETNASTVIEAIEHFGQVPLPPYIERDVESSDKDSYQAIFAEKEGAVAAPTASLHFTDELKTRIESKGCRFDEVTLHISAGTFKPVTAEFSNEHEMHAERFEVGVDFIDRLLDDHKGVLAIGTTATRVLESLYYLGEKALYGDLSECFVAASDAYSERYGKITMRESLIALREYAIKQGGVVRGETQIFIVPGFKFRLVQWMITNFHQPKSTLLMLISAFIGEGWKDVYGHAIGGDYRFLSYGDGSLLTCKINISY